MEILKVTDAEFRTYGRVLEGYDMTDLLKAMEHAPLPPDEVIYEPSIEELEGLKIAGEMKERAYGGLEIQIGYCNGNNKKLNAVVDNTFDFEVINYRSYYKTQNWK